MVADFKRRFPLMESGLIGFRAPPLASNRSCSERTLHYIQLLASECILQDVEIQCSTNIWSPSIQADGTCLGSSPSIQADGPCLGSSPDLGVEELARGDLNTAESDSSSEYWQMSKHSPVSSHSSEENMSWNHRELDQMFVPSTLAPPVDVMPTAKFFVIKSYSASDVATSVKNKIWASTDLGNKRLDKAYEDSNGEVFLFFSVNGSSKFCGVAKMLGPVDFSKSSNAWVEASRWNGIFPVTWIVYRDINNKTFRRLRVPSNENKPVSNSRDTQELPYEIGMSMLAIFFAGSA